MKKNLRGLSAILLSLTLAAGAAQAQTEVRTPSPAQSLACLVKPDKPPKFPRRDKLDLGTGAMRVLLKFKQHDAKPEVELLFNSARQDMQDEVLSYLGGYRLPCLRAEDGEVRAVQEFHFSNSDRQAEPLPPAKPADEPPFCVVAPREDIDYTMGMGRPEVEHLVVVATFTGNGQQPPQVKVLHSTASDRLERAVREQLAKFRMPCRSGREAPQSFQQQFSMFPVGKSRYGFTREAFGLGEFLGMTREPQRLTAHYDFTTMGCPFSVNYKVHGGTLPNMVTLIGPDDPNKLPFLKWLAGLQLAFKNAQQANDLFGSTLQVNVPCGALQLGEKSAATEG